MRFLAALVRTSAGYGCVPAILDRRVHCTRNDVPELDADHFGYPFYLDCHQQSYSRLALSTSGPRAFRHQRSMSGTGAKRTYRGALHMSAFRANADTTLDGVTQSTLSLTDPLWGVGVILYKAHVDPQRAGSST